MWSCLLAASPCFRENPSSLCAESSALQGSEHAQTVATLSAQEEGTIVTLVSMVFPTRMQDEQTRVHRFPVELDANVKRPFPPAWGRVLVTV